MDPAPSPKEQLEQLLPPAPPLDTATVSTGLGDAAARLSVARLLAREAGPAEQAEQAEQADPGREPQA